MLRSLLGVARAPFLLLPVTLVGVGATVSGWRGDFNLLHSIVALVGLVALHVAVNVLNEISDFRRGIDLHTERTPFSGGSGTLPAGGLDVGMAWGLAVAGCLVGLGAGIWLLSEVGRTLVPVMVLGALATLTYTDLLARVYLGELFAGLGLGLLPVAGTSIAQSGQLDGSAVVAGVPAFLMTFNLLLLNEFPDEGPDRVGGRRNLLILLGRPGAARLYVLAGVLTPASILTGVLSGWLPALAALGVAPSLLLVGPARWALGRPAEPVPLPALGANVAWNLSTNALLAVGLGLAWWLES